MKAAPILLAWLGLWAGGCAAHEVHHVVSATGAAMVTLRYADGKPFAYEKYELTPDGAQVPSQVGNTDAEGRVVFVPGAVDRWRLKAYTTDGHGADLRFVAPPGATPAATPAAASGPDRTSLVLFGVGLIFGGFGLYQMFLARRKPS